jgi:glycosyltransferase involved in cell wall biosynthesis
MILIFSNLKKAGGGEKAATNMAKLYCVNNEVFFFSWLNVKLYKVDENFSFKKKFFLLLPLIVIKAEIIYSHLYISNILTLFFFGLFKNKIKLFNHGSINNITFYPNIQKYLVKILYNKAKSIYCVTDPIYHELINLQIKENKLKILKNPIIVNKKLRLNKKRSNFLYLGRIEPIKNLEPMLKYFAGLKINKLEIYGDGSLVNFYKSNYENFWNFSYKGSTSDPFDVLSNVKAIILISHREGLPMVLLEALVVNTPLVLSHNLMEASELLGQRKAIRAYIDIYENGIILKDNSKRAFDAAITEIDNGTISVSNKKVLDEYMPKHFLAKLAVK